jgi:tripartite-type tricarboxylate transporter receptor subunit TctC
MKLPRRTFLHLAAGAAALPTVSHIAWAQAYPTRPVRIIVGFPPGGSYDIQARLIGQWLSEALGQQFIVDNRPGAGTNIAAEAVIRAPPDAYTLLLAGPPNAINATLYDKLQFDFIRDTAPVAGISRGPLVLLVNPSVPSKTLPEFIAYAKANPGKLNMASAGNGTIPHVVGELFKIMAAVDMIHVPYRGGAPALTDLLSGQVHMYFGLVPSSVEHIRTGKLRALAVTSATRSDALPGVPTVSDFVSGFEATDWTGISAPKDASAEIVKKLNEKINAGLGQPNIKARLADFGAEAMTGPPVEFGKLVAEETNKWGKVIRSVGIKAE